MIQIFESVPNISEGRDKKKIERLLTEIKTVRDLKILDHSSDTDHNRSVFTYIGTYNAVKEASLKLVKTAREILDINEHQGVHPCNGVVDVLPIIPVKNCEMSDAVRLSKDIGETIKNSLEIPVYYYENSAQDEKYQNLALLRADSYNLSRHKSAGFIAVGARDFLVAFNVNLDSNNLNEAKKIAEELREKKSHLRGVKALGLYLASRDIVQVSMNLTRPFEVGPEEVFQAVCKKAEACNMKVLERELIGKLPKAVIKEAEALYEDLNVLIEKAKEQKNDNTNTKRG